MSQPRVLITGAGGFVGRALAVGFAALGWRVLGVDRTFSDMPDRRGGFQIAADLATEGVPAFVPSVDLVIHAAWITSDPEALGVSEAEYIDLNIRPLSAVLEYAARSGPKAFVFISSSGVFSSTDGTQGLTDSDRPTAKTPYATSKLVAEDLVDSALSHMSPGSNLHVVRLGYLFGPGERARPSRKRVSLVAEWLAAARAGGPLRVRADNPQRDWTYAPDLAAALECLAAGPTAGRALHLGSPYASGDAEVAGLIASHFPNAEIVEVPAERPVKPPMVPSKLPSLDGLKWTDLATGIRALATAEAAA